MALNCAYRRPDDYFPGTTAPRERASLYQHGRLKDCQMEECEASREKIDMEKIMAALERRTAIQAILTKPFIIAFGSADCAVAARTVLPLVLVPCGGGGRSRIKK